MASLIFDEASAVAEHPHQQCQLQGSTDRFKAMSPDPRVPIAQQVAQEFT